MQGQRRRALVTALRTIEQLDPAGAAAAYIAVLTLLVLAGAAVIVVSTGRGRPPGTPAPR